MKKILNAFFVVVICLFFSAGICSASNPQDDANAFFYAIKVLEKYYNAIDQNKDADFSGDLAVPMLMEYVNKKVEGLRYKFEVYDKDDIQNYELNFSLINIENKDNLIKLTIGVDIEYNYKNASFDSAYGELIHMVLEKNNNEYKVIDWYLPEDDYDMEVLGELDENESIFGWTKIARSENLISERQEEINNEIKSYYDDLKWQADWTKGDFEQYDELTIMDSKVALYSLNKSNMVTWANNNCTKASPSSGNANQAVYYDFSKISGNYDCTNFVSHALLAGGAVVYNTGGTGISSTGWNYKSLDNRSSSWSGVPNLYNFLTTNKTKGPVGKYVEYSNIYAPLGNYPYESGDILQFHNGSVWRHSTLITGYIAVTGSSTTLEAIVTGRTSSSTYNKNQRQSSISPGKKRRVIKVSGYYK